MFSLGPGFSWSGRMEKSLAPLHLQDVLARLEKVKGLAISERRFTSLELPGVIALAIAPSGSEELRVWGNGRGLEVGEFAGPPTNVVETDRLAFKLRREQEQLPRDGSNVVIINSAPLTAIPWDPHQLSQIAHCLEEEVFKHPHICYCGIIFSWVGGNVTSALTSGEHFCVNRQRFDFMCDTVLLLRNRFATRPLPEPIDRRFKASFIGTVP